MKSGSGSGEEETRRKMVDIKYEQFEKECGHLLDPNLVREFAVMRSLGLPTKLINSYGDMDSEEVWGGGGSKTSGVRRGERKG